MKSEVESILIRFVKGKVPLATSFWMIWVPIYLVLIVGAGPFGGWWGYMISEYNVPEPLLPIILFAVGLVVSVGTIASAWKARAYLALSVVVVVSVLTLFGLLKVVWFFW